MARPVLQHRGGHVFSVHDQHQHLLLASVPLDHHLSVGSDEQVPKRPRSPAASVETDRDRGLCCPLSRARYVRDPGAAGHSGGRVARPPHARCVRPGEAPACLVLAGRRRPERVLVASPLRARPLGSVTEQQARSGRNLQLWPSCLQRERQRPGWSLRSPLSYASSPPADNVQRGARLIVVRCR